MLTGRKATSPVIMVSIISLPRVLGFYDLGLSFIFDIPYIPDYKATGYVRRPPIFEEKNLVLSYYRYTVLDDLLSHGKVHCSTALNLLL